MDTRAQVERFIPQSNSGYDVIVAGGGPAGIGAALAAAKQGAKTLLLEARSFFGGVATLSHWMPMNRLLLNGGSRGGVHDLFVARVRQYGEVASCAGPSDWVNGDGLHIHVDYLRLAVFEMLEEAGCHYRLYSPITDVIMDGNALRGVVSQAKGGRSAFEASVVVDATGDGDVAFLAGAPVACSRVTCLPWLTSNAALLFDPGDLDDMASGVLKLWTDDGLRRELLPWGIQVMSVVAGGVKDTEFNKQAASNGGIRFNGLPVSRVPKEEVANRMVALVQKPRRTVHLGRFYAVPVFFNQLSPGFVDSASTLFVRWKQRREFGGPLRLVGSRLFQLTAGAAGILAAMTIARRIIPTSCVCFGSEWPRIFRMIGLWPGWRAKPDTATNTCAGFAGVKWAAARCIRSHTCECAVRRSSSRRPNKQLKQSRERSAITTHSSSRMLSPSGLAGDLQSTGGRNTQQQPATETADALARSACRELARLRRR